MDIFHQIIEKNQSILITLAEIVVFTVFVSLILYHLLIFMGRRASPDGKLYLYMSMLLAGFLLYIFLDTNMYYILASLILETARWTTFFTAVSWFIIFRSIQLLLKVSLILPNQKAWLAEKAIYWYLLLLIVWMIPVVVDLTPYHRKIFLGFWFFNGLVISFYAFIYAGELVNNYKRLESGIKIIALTALIYIIYIWFYRLAIITFPSHLLLPFWFLNNLFKIAVAFVFAYALIIRFNKEYSDLVVLKEGLEKKVAEKTSELQLAKIKIENASKMKTDYFIQVAHETKTPLTLITNYLDRYIKKSTPSEELSIIRENFRLLGESMIHFLDTEKFEKDMAGYQHDRVTDLTQLIRVKIPLYNELAKIKDRIFSYETEDNVFVKADHLAIERVVNNLFDNALKFTDQFDSVFLTLKKVDDFAHLAVGDTGPGIDSESLNKIFEPYFQLVATGKSHAGMGMGLYIVKEIMDSIGGNIHVESIQGEGTVFELIFPITHDRIQGNKSETENMDLYSISPKTASEDIFPERKNILIIEDNRDMRSYLVAELSDEFNVIQAVNGVEALSLLKTGPLADLILSDVMMDTMDGFELFELISQDSRFNSIPFLFITARSVHQEKVEMLNKGVSDYIYKPFSIDELKAKIRSALINAEVQRKSAINQAVDLLNMKLASGSSRTVADKWDIFTARSKDYQLTNRQIEIIREVEKGLEYKQIADNLHISPKTVHRHMQILFEKFKVHSKIELLKILFE
jgi:signal transduction histidine kinase/DNA-binding NarL/FixJ family response regulator